MQGFLSEACLRCLEQSTNRGPEEEKRAIGIIKKNYHVFEILKIASILLFSLKYTYVYKFPLFEESFRDLNYRI